MVQDEQLNGWVRALAEAREKARPVDLNGELGELDGETAYEVQRRVEAGRRGQIAGFKIGWADAAARKANGVPEAVFGRYVAEDVVRDGGAVARESLINPSLEGELVVVVEREISGAALAPEEVRGACRMAVGFDLFDSRLLGGAANWRALAADDCGAGRVVVGLARAPLPDPLSLARVKVALRRNGEPAAEGSGSKLEDPAATVAWLARRPLARS